MLTALSGSGYTVGSPAGGSGSIADNDVATPTVTVTATDASGSEAPGNTITYTVIRTGNLTGALVLNLGWSGTATGGADYAASAGATITLAAGVASATITVTPIDDSAVESAETVVLTVLGGAGYMVGSPSSASATIADNDMAGPTVSIADASVVEGNKGTKTVTLAITLSTAATASVTVDYSTANGTAVAGLDYTAKSGSVVFSAGQLSKTITVSIPTDRTAEPDETFVVNLTSISGPATIADAQAVVTILNDDGTVALSYVASTSTSGDARISSSLVDDDLLIRPRAFRIDTGNTRVLAAKAVAKKKQKAVRVAAKPLICRKADIRT